MGTNTDTGGCLNRRAFLDVSVDGHISVALEARVIPPSPRSGSSFFCGGTPAILVLVSTSDPA
eukprot:2231198-Pyramimonas_sp.AAC.1